MVELAVREEVPGILLHRLEVALLVRVLLVATPTS
jgi:hypothetical protein